MQLVIAQKRPQMHLLHSAGKLADLGLLLLILLEPLLVAPLRLLHIKAVIAGIKLRFPSFRAMMRSTQRSRK